MKDMTVHPRRCRFEEQPQVLSPARHGEACRLLPGPAGELAAALKRKEPTAFEHLIAQHRTVLYRLPLQFIDQPEEAEDVVQETLLTVYKKIHTFEERSALTTWLHRIVVNIALMRLRAKARVPVELLGPAGPHVMEQEWHEQEVPWWVAPPEESLLHQEALRVLQQAMARLPERYRPVCVLAEIDGLRHREIGAMLKLTVGAVKTRRHRARLLLRRMLTDYFVERRRPPHSP
jgi:RNA polymerase sigma-70 factor, ECF subfamily